MPVIGKWADHGKAIREGHVIHGSDHEADPASYRVRRMGTQTIHSGRPKLIKNQAGCQSHTAGNAGCRLPLQRQGGIFADIRQGGAEQGWEIHAKAFCECRCFGFAAVEQCQAIRRYVLDAVSGLFRRRTHAAAPTILPLSVWRFSPLLVQKFNISVTPATLSLHAGKECDREDQGMERDRR